MSRLPPIRFDLRSTPRRSAAPDPDSASDISSSDRERALYRTRATEQRRRRVGRGRWTRREGHGGLAESCPSQRRKDKPRVGRDAERRWDVMQAHRSAARRVDRVAPARRDRSRAGPDDGWRRRLCARRSSGPHPAARRRPRRSDACLSAPRAGAADEAYHRGRAKSARRGASASGRRRARLACLAARVASFTVGARPIARDASRRPEVSARAAEGFGRVSTVDSPASSDADAETDRDRDPSSPTVAPNGSDTNTRAETDATGAVVAPRAERATASDVRAERADRVGPSTATRAGNRIRRAAPPPSNSTKSVGPSFGDANLATTHPPRRRSRAPSAISPGSGSAGDSGRANGGARGGVHGRRGPRPRHAARRSRDASNSSAIDAVSTRCSSSLKFPRCRRPPNGRRITVGA